MTVPAPSFLLTLCRLRWLAVVGQSVTVLAVVHGFGLRMDTRPLWLGIGLLAAFNLYARRRAAGVRDPSPAESFLHVGVDVVVLTWLIVWSGGLGNPFSSLFLLPIALTALALPLRWVWATAALSLAGYLLSAWLSQPLPHAHGMAGDGFGLHLWGMGANFLVSMAVVLFFLTHLAGTLRRRERELAGLREQFARSEGIVALATHAASVSHELNTPLGTLTLMLDDLSERGLSQDVEEDCRVMRRIVDDCRDRVRELAAPAGPAGDAGVQLGRVIARWQLVRPGIDLRRGGSFDAAGTRVDVAVGHLLQALLDNAADASERAGSARVDLLLEVDGDRLRGEVRDHGEGFERARPFLPGRLFGSTKPGGLGVGLALSHATVERFGGRLEMAPAQTSGVCVRFVLPLSKIAR